ncbi:MAG: hypothetical protein ACRCY4_08735 [Brevinema sp.]
MLVVLLWVFMGIIGHTHAQATTESSVPVPPSAPLNIFSVVNAFPGSATTNSTTNIFNSPVFAAQVGEYGLSPQEIARIDGFLAQTELDVSEADISQAGIFPIIDAETRYFNNPDAAAGAVAPNPKTTANPFLQFLYTKNIANGQELLSHKTNDTTFFNIYGVYNLRIALQKDISPVPKPSFAKRGELEFLIFSQKMFVPINSYGQKITLTLYGSDNKLKWTKEFLFDMRQAQQRYLDPRIKKLTLHHLLEKEELDELRMLFRANQVIFGRVDGVLDSFLFDFRPKTTHFYRSFLEYGKANRYF